MSKIIMHIDLNQFFVSCERIVDPSLNNVPLVVGSTSRRGIVSTASYEARKFGIHSAQPIYLAKKLCPTIIIKEPNFDLYSKKSHEFIDFIKQNYTKKIEQVSIDECYVDMTDLMENVVDPISYLKELQNKLLETTGLASSIGVGKTKFLAKMGSDYKKPMGITIIRKRDIKKLLYPLEIEDFFGFGKKTCPRLRELGINTIGDFALSNNPNVKKLMGKMYDQGKLWINGEGDDEIIDEYIDPKSVSSTTTFLYDTNDYEEIKEMLLLKAQEVSYELKEKHLVGKNIILILKDSNFKTISKSITIENYISSFDIIYSNVMKIFDNFYKNQLIRLAGVGVTSLKKEDEVFEQISLFDQENYQKKYKSKLLLNKLNNHLKKDVFILASSLKDKKNENK